jgi:hypothetical protein
MPAPAKRALPACFLPGHPKYGGRKPVNQAQRYCGVETARKMGIDPVALMLAIIRDGVMAQPDGTGLTVSLDERMRLLREVAPYVVSKAPTKVESRIDHTHLDITRVMLDPTVADLADQLAEAMAEGTRQLPAASDVIDADFEPVLDLDNP